uniref:Uncharacterized protein n=1 Tax=Aegilops tauschii subsp. strangulata TaxID=200361 RepID=A0A453B968_AEGTS
MPLLCLLDHFSVWVLMFNFVSTDPFMDRDMIIQRGRPSDELPEMTPAYVTFSTLAIFILTIFTNVVFNVYIKPSVDGADQPVRIQRVPLADPSFQQPGNSSGSS